MAYNILDIVIAVLLVLGLVNGIRQGFVRQIASLAAILLAASAYGLVAPYVTGLLGGGRMTRGLSLLGSMLAFWLILFLANRIGRGLSRLVNCSPLGLLNKMAGALTGLSVTVISVGLIGLLIDFLVPIQKGEASGIFAVEGRDIRASSKFYETTKELVPTILPFNLFRERPK